MGSDKLCCYGDDVALAVALEDQPQMLLDEPIGLDVEVTKSVKSLVGIAEVEDQANLTEFLKRVSGVNDV